MADETEPDGRLSRWSKRKLAVAKEQEGEEPEQAAPAPESEVAVEREEMLLAHREAAEAVDLETLNKDSDFSVFLKEGVPELLKKKAMLTLWRSNPVFANIDGLCDYDDDFGSPDLIMETFKSAYTAGKGYLHLLEEKDDDELELMSENEAEDESGVNEQEAEDIDPQDLPTSEEFEDQLPDVEPVAYAAENTELDILPEDFAPPKVSLRKRLQLEGEG